MEDFYLTIKKGGSSVFRDRGSRFLGFTFPVMSDDQIREILDRLRKEYHDARHHCYAYRLGETGGSFRSSDDGEPSGSAGKPILNQITSRNMTHVLVVVIRYFGGTLLGVGGLIHAYRSAASEALDNSGILKRNIESVYKLVFDYSRTNEVARLLGEFNARIIQQNFTDKCHYEISVIRSMSENLIRKLSLLENVAVTAVDSGSLH